MTSNKVQRFVAAGFVAAALAVASLGATGVSANQQQDDASGSSNSPQQAVVQPFTSAYTVNAVPVVPGYTVNAVPFVSPSYGVNQIPFVPVGGQVDTSGIGNNH